MQEVNIRPTSRLTAASDDFVLRETATTRLVFRPVILENKKNKDASVKGHFVFQRKAPRDEWEDYRELTLTNLRASEWVKLELHSEELLTLVNRVQKLYGIVKMHGIPSEPTRFIQVRTRLAEILRASEEDWNRFLDLYPDTALEIISRLLRWLLGEREASGAIAKLERLSLGTLQQLNLVAAIGAFTEALQVWEQDARNQNEEFWQTFLTDHAFMLAQLFSYPVVIVRDKAYVGGKTIENTGGKLVDFLMKNELTGNAILIEIKTPTTALLGREYRSGVYPPSSDLSGAIVQVSTYKQSLLVEYSHLQPDSHQGLEPFYPRCLIISGNTTELDTAAKTTSFELFRNGLRDVEIITFDELFRKISTLVHLLQGDG